ncbi:hypothetical protein B0H13DRAFT_366357 [Mycena leptocephala]|nr:hypothetical protein B0H13DRAFT_366357 [Mycena leptocephala]
MFPLNYPAVNCMLHINWLFLASRSSSAVSDPIHGTLHGGTDYAVVRVTSGNCNQSQGTRRGFHHCPRSDGLLFHCGHLRRCRSFGFGDLLPGRTRPDLQGRCGREGLS